MAKHITLTPSTVQAALLEAVPPAANRFMPMGEFRTRATESGYIEEELFASGTDETGALYRTQVFVRRPRDPARFSGIVIVEPLHFDGIAPIYMYTSPYILGSGHGWACVASQKTSLDQHVKAAAPDLYATLSIASPRGEPTELTRPDIVGGRPEDLLPFMHAVERVNAASPMILAQAGAALRSASGPFGAVSKLLLVGHSQTGRATTNFIKSLHFSQRLPDGAPIYDGFFPSGFPDAPLGPLGVPLIQVMSDGDVFDVRERLLDPRHPGRHYRRPDSDSPDDHFRLYELAGVPHLGTRHPPLSDTRVSSERQGGLVKPSDRMNSLPHNELFSAALDHLIGWTAGRVPPKADRLELDAGGRFFAQDEHGNTRGGVRCPQMDVPHSTYHPVPLTEDGSPGFATVGTEERFSAEKLAALYGNPAEYRRRFECRTAELIEQGWLLPADAAGMQAEAAELAW